MFFNPRVYEKISDRKVVLNEKRKVVSDGNINSFILSEISSLNSENYADESQIFCTKIYIHSHMDTEVKEKIIEYKGDYVKNSEGYAILTGEEIHIWAEDEAGVLYAVATLRQMMDFDELWESFVYDYPRSSFRGYRVFVPGRSYIDDFKRTIDLLAYYKFNTIMIQVGGAMEYKSHPEINTTWEEYCAYLTEFPHRTEYHRNKWNFCTTGTHPDAGDGSYITQEEMRDIVEYCKLRKIEVIPEIPSYNHCDYLVMAHPEIRELSRAHDCADGYCPSNPASYELLFDVIDEIVDVFDPKYINISHDELCQINACEKCRHKSPAELLAEDVTKIHDYLSSKGIRTMMWSDTLASPEKNGIQMQGRGSGYNKQGDWDYIPSTNECRFMLPKDIIMITWLFSGEYRNTEDILCSEGYETIFANLYDGYIQNWDERTEKNQIQGAMVSNWGTNEIYYTRRNLNFYALIRISYAFWDECYDENKNDEILSNVYKECYRYFNKYLASSYKKNIEIIHTTNLNVNFSFYFSARKIDMKKVKIGDYVVMYDDGTTARLPVIYGDNISNENPSERLLGEICCCAQIIKTDKIYYKYRYENPYPEKNIISVSFLKQMPTEASVYIKEIHF